MRPRNETTRFVRRWLRRGLPLALIAGSLLVLQASDCSKPREFFIPVVTSGGNGLEDITQPDITNFLPAGANVPLNDVFAMATITDQVGSNGATPSGVPLSGILAQNGATLPVTSSGMNMYNADISGLGDGAHSINWTATDLAGNTATATQSIMVDRTAPDVSITQMPNATGMSDQPTVDLTYGFTIADPHFATATFAVFNCNTGAPWPEGTGPGQVEDQSQTYTTAGSQTTTFRFHNGNTGSTDVVAPYCFNGVALDGALSKSSQPSANSIEFSGRVDFTWKPMTGGGGSFIVTNPLMDYLHVSAGDSRTCASWGTNPAQPNAPYTVSWSGPGTVGQTTRSGNLNGAGQGFDQQMINQFGSYGASVSVTSNGTTQMASGTVNVTASQGGCTQVSSSARFKSDVTGLLPAGVRPLGLRPVAFHYVDPYGDPGRAQIGLIAEEVAARYPEAVVLDGEGRPTAIVYDMLVERVVEAGVERAGHAVGATIARFAAALAE